MWVSLVDLVRSRFLGTRFQCDMTSECIYDVCFPKRSPVNDFVHSIQDLASARLFKASR